MAENTKEYDENETRSVLTLSASDPEDATPITWSLPTGVDADDECSAITGDLDGTGPLVEGDFVDNCQFKISQSGVLEFMSPPNHESQADEDTNNSYNVVVQATDGDAGATPEDTRGWFKVTVNVSDVEETGTVTLRPAAQTSTTLLQPQVGVNITAANLMDGDGTTADRGISAITIGATYQWYRTANRSATGTAISSTRTGSTGTEASYEPVHLAGGDSDIGQYLRVVATYTDGKGGGKTATAVSLHRTIREIDDNDPPSFIDGAATTRGVRETNEKDVNIGLPVTATDPEGADDEKLTYWLTGSNTVDNVADTNDANVNTLFSIDATNGQLKTNAPLNREVTPSYEVTVNVTDSSGAACDPNADPPADPPDNCDEITMTIEVLELDESPTISGASTIEHVEGATVLDLDLIDNDLDLVTNNFPSIGGTTDSDPEPAVYTATDPGGRHHHILPGRGGQGPVQARRPCDS